MVAILVMQVVHMLVDELYVAETVDPVEMKFPPNGNGKQPTNRVRWLRPKIKVNARSFWVCRPRFQHNDFVRCPGRYARRT